VTCAGTTSPTALTDNSGQWNSSGQNVAWAQNVQYDYAGRMTAMQSLLSTQTCCSNPPTVVQNNYVTQAMTYNANGQMLTQTFGTACTPNCSWFGTPSSVNGGLTYTNSGTQNNGQVTQLDDTISGETVVYAYDALKRLIQASSTPNSGSSPTAWTQGYSYDGFGNLTGKTLNGTLASIPVNGTTNQLTNAYYDANGNMTSGAGLTLTYDEANRVASAHPASGGTEYYGYAPDNKRVYKLTATGTEQWTFYGAQGERMIEGLTLSRTFNWDNGNALPFGGGSLDVWFAGKLIWQQNASVYGDRLGSNRGAGRGFIRMGMRSRRPRTIG